MTNLKLAILTAITMIAFASNSLLCRQALANTQIDPASFTTIRITAGAIVLGLIALIARREREGQGSWRAASALLVYAAGFSFAYESLSAATGALILFGAVQATMIGHGLIKGERPGGIESLGMLVAMGGLVGLLIPGLSAPPLVGALLMGASGVAWGVYSLLGKGAGDPTRVTAGNFARAVPMALCVSAATWSRGEMDMEGVGYAIASGALTSGVGYAIWYSVLPWLKAAHAATVQLSVPVIAAMGGALWLSESITTRLMVATVAILGGIAMVISKRQKAGDEVRG